MLLGTRGSYVAVSDVAIAGAVFFLLLPRCSVGVWKPPASSENSALLMNERSSPKCGVSSRRIPNLMELDEFVNNVQAFLWSRLRSGARRHSTRLRPRLFSRVSRSSSVRSVPSTAAAAAEAPDTCTLMTRRRSMAPSGKATPSDDEAAPLAPLSENEPRSPPPPLPLLSGEDSDEDSSS